MKRSLKLLSTAFASIMICAVMTGCVKSKITVKVNADGTGNIIVSRIFPKEIVTMITAQMKQMRKQIEQMGDMSGAADYKIPDDPFYNEKQLKKQAGQFGEGVELVKSVKYDKDGSQGYIALYKFEDINRIFINMKLIAFDENSASMGMGMGMNDDDEDEIEIAEKDDDAFEFSLKGTDVKTLKVVVPNYTEPDVAADEDSSEFDEPAFGGPGGDQGLQQMMAMGNPFGFTGKESQGEAIIKSMKGFGQTVSLEVTGTGHKSNATDAAVPSKEGVRYVLLDMDMDKILSTPKGKKSVSFESMEGMGPGDGSLVQFYSNMIGVPGMTAQTNDLVVNFK